MSSVDPDAVDRVLTVSQVTDAICNRVCIIGGCGSDFNALHLRNMTVGAPDLEALTPALLHLDFLYQDRSALCSEHCIQG